MKRSFYVSSWATVLPTWLLLLVTSSATYAQETEVFPALKPAVEIEDIEVVGSARAGDVFTFHVRYTMHLDADAEVILLASDNVELPTQVEGQLLRLPVTLRAGQTQEREFTLRMREAGAASIQVELFVPEAPPGYAKTASRHLTIESTATSFEVFDPEQPGDREPEEVQMIRGQQEQAGKQAAASQQYTVSVSGKIRFYSSIDGAYKGVYGNGVRLWFRNSSNPNTWYHPITTEQEGVTYDLLDEQGNFSFNFSFSGSLSSYNQVIVIVNTANKSAFLPLPANGYTSWGINGFTNYFNEANGVIASINGSSSTITVSKNNDVFPRGEGQVLRYMMLSRDFAVARYSGGASISAIYTSIRDLPGTGAGLFCAVSNCSGQPTQPYGPYMMIDPIYTEFTTVSHEYGHYVNFRMWNSSSGNFGSANLNLVEGWATFYSFAARNYMNERYGDNLLVDDDWS